MTGITPEGFEIDRDFAAPPSAVFAAWTTAEHFARWFCGNDVQVPADRLDYEPATRRAWSATMVLPDGNTIDWRMSSSRCGPVNPAMSTANRAHTCPSAGWAGVLADGRLTAGPRR